MELCSYINSEVDGCIKLIPPQLLSVISLVSGKKERKMILTLENHSYIRQLFQELMKHFQASVGQTRWLFFINQGLPNSLHNVLQLSQFILVYAKKIKSLSIYVCLFPIAYRSFSTECPWFCLGFFSQQNPNNCFVKCFSR